MFALPHSDSRFSLGLGLCSLATSSAPSLFKLSTIKLRFAKDLIDDIVCLTEPCGKCFPAGDIHGVLLHMVAKVLTTVRASIQHTHRVYQVTSCLLLLLSRLFRIVGGSCMQEFPCRASKLTPCQGALTVLVRVLVLAAHHGVEHVLLIVAHGLCAVRARGSCTACGVGSRDCDSCETEARHCQDGATHAALCCQSPSCCQHAV
mmetsp:Transcript_10569/g.20801  ORF Transcript_10569/g.20801 Transcript_10569/m.20801 type:complete len:204 (+) Transcript_10569:442-1053(+)